MKEKIKKELKQLADEKYKEFHKGLCPGTENILGIRVPILRDYARKLSKEYEIHELLNNIDDEYYEEIMQWHEKRNRVTGLKKEHIGYENGVLGGAVSALNVLCSKGDSVLLHSPTYIGFTGALTNNGYNIVLSPLVQDDKGMWRMDLEDMERKIIENKIHAAILCSHHNPTGRVWEREELEKMMGKP